MDNKIIPVIVQHFETNQILTLAYMNNEALQRTIKGPDVWFYSRSRKELWHKGETSGNYLKVKSISIDCDNDALLVKVYPTGPSCHTGKESCFSNEDLANIEWKSSCDTETLLEYISNYGLLNTLMENKGMFAFGLFDIISLTGLDFPLI